MLLTDEGELRRAEPKTLRYRLLHTAARITRGQRKVFLRPALALDPRARPSLPTPAAHPAPGLTASTTSSRTPTSKITETPDLAPEPPHAST
jgi:hypothetical protein